MPNEISTDILIFGGGAAGLWLLGRLRRAGYEALLLEAARLGEGQTRHAQGIIHGGTKYSLHGAVSASAEAVAAMPARWRACLQGGGDMDLGAVRVLSEHHYLWSTASMTSRMSGFLASHAMRARSRALSGDQRPAVFRNDAFRGQVYELDEPVIDAVSLVHALAEPRLERTLQLPDREQWSLRADDHAVVLEMQQPETGALALRAQAAVFAAGAGNATLLAALDRPEPRMQRRALHMVLARGALPDLFAHCLGASRNPRVTVTTHSRRGDRAVWYLGGQLAEDGVGRSRDAQIDAARGELRTLLPWIDIGALEWSTLPIDRAEPAQPDGARPAGAFARWDRRVVTVWPTKLALAPLVSDRVLSLLREHDVQPRVEPAAVDWPRPAYAPPPWEEETLSWS